MEEDKGALALDDFLGGVEGSHGCRGLEVPDPWEWVAFERSLQGNWKEESEDFCEMKHQKFLSVRRGVQ